MKKRGYDAELKKLGLVRQGLVKAGIPGLTVRKIERYTPFASFSFRYEKEFNIFGGSISMNGDTRLMYLIVGGGRKAAANEVKNMISLAVEIITEFAEDK
jgi:hypothetical protein